MDTTFGSGKGKTLFQDERPDVLRMSELYDPVRQTGIIPSLDTVLIDDNNNGALYYVTHIHPETHEVTYKPCKIVYSLEEGHTSVIDYTNTRFSVFYDDRVEPTRLNIDSVLAFYGNDNVNYRLIRKDPSTNEEQMVSMYYDSDGKFKGHLIPLRAITTGSNIKFATNCHTTLKLVDNEQITMEVFDHTGVMQASVKLFTQRAVVITDNVPVPVITNMVLTGTQIKDGKFYLYEKQDISNLHIQPEVHYSNGSVELVPIDNQRCFLYGYDDVIASTPGMVHQLMCKYYLRADQVSQSAIDSGKGRYEVAVRDITIVSNNAIFGCKASVIPIWNHPLAKYDLKFFLYTNNRDMTKDITLYTNILNVSDIDTSIFGEYQNIKISVDMQRLLHLNEESYHVQSFWIRFEHYFMNTSVPYLIKDNKEDTHVYGTDSSIMSRPVVYYDTVNNIYFVPTSKFSNKQAFVEAGYDTVVPPFHTGREIAPPRPTHFTFRDAITGNPIITHPVPIEEYHQALRVMVPTGEDNNYYLNKTVVLEWLTESDTGFLIVYGVPIDIRRSIKPYGG